MTRPTWKPWPKSEAAVMGNKYSQRICMRCGRIYPSTIGWKCPKCGGIVTDRDRRKKEQERKLYSEWWRDTHEK